MRKIDYLRLFTSLFQTTKSTAQIRSSVGLKWQELTYIRWISPVVATSECSATTLWLCQTKNDGKNHHAFHGTMTTISTGPFSSSRFCWHHQRVSMNHRLIHGIHHISSRLGSSFCKHVTIFYPGQTQLSTDHREAVGLAYLMFGLIVRSSATPGVTSYRGAVVTTCRDSRCPCGWVWPVPMTMETCWWRWSRKQIKNGSGTLESLGVIGCFWNHLARKLWHSCEKDISIDAIACSQHHWIDDISSIDIYNIIF